jgi:tRNA(Ile)-lysidine synthase TilS/MesJ
LCGFAQKIVENKVALGSHREGIAETLFSNLVLQDKIKAMP